MVWPAIIGAAVGGGLSLWGADEDEKALEAANKQQQQFLDEALMFLGTPGELSYQVGPDAAAVLADMIARTTGTSGQSQIHEWTQMLLSGTSDVSSQHAREQLEKHLAKHGGGAQLDEFLRQAQTQADARPTELTAFGRINELFGVAQKAMEDRARFLEQGYGKALKSLAGVGAGAQASIIREGKQTAAAGAQDLAARGLANTSVMGQYQKAQRGQTARELTDFATAFAPLKANAQAMLGEARARGAEGMASLSQTRAGLETDLNLAHVNAMLARQVVPGASFTDALGGMQGAMQFGKQIGQAAEGLYDWWSEQ